MNLKPYRKMNIDCYYFAPRLKAYGYNTSRIKNIFIFEEIFSMVRFRPISVYKKRNLLIEAVLAESVIPSMISDLIQFIKICLPELRFVKIAVFSKSLGTSQKPQVFIDSIRIHV